MPLPGIRKEDLISNPTPRVAVGLCLDVSPSMSGKVELGAHPGTVGVPIDELNDGLRRFYAAVQGDSRSKYAVEVAVVSFSHDYVIERDFEPIVHAQPPQLSLRGSGTVIGSAVDACLARLDERKREYKDAGVDYYQPWLVLMTDGRPTDESHKAAASRVKQLVQERKLTILPIGVGGGADMQTLALFADSRGPLRLRSLMFHEFFEFLSKSIDRVTHSQLTEHVSWASQDAKGWSEPL